MCDFTAIGLGKRHFESEQAPSATVCPSVQVSYRFNSYCFLTIMDCAHSFVRDASSKRVDVCLPWNGVTEASKAAEAVRTGVVRCCAFIASVGPRSCQQIFVDSMKRKGKNWSMATMRSISQTHAGVCVCMCVCLCIYACGWFTYHSAFHNACRL